MVYDHRYGIEPEHHGASKPQDITPGKSTVTSKMAAGKAISLEHRLEALEVHVDQLDELGLKLMTNLSSGAAPAYAVAVRAKLDVGGQIAEKLRGARTTLKRKGLYEAAHEALTRLLALEAQFGTVADSIIASSSAPKRESADAFGVHQEAEPEMDPVPDLAITSSPIINEGYLCEQTAHRNNKSLSCGLDSRSRDQLRGDLEGVVSSAMMNFSTAIQNARLDALTTTEHGWGFLAEFLFFSLTGPLISQAVKGFEKYRTAKKAANAVDGLDALRGANAAKSLVERANKEDVQALLTNASRALRANLRNAVNGRSDESHDKAAFLLVMQEQIKPLGDSIWRTAPTMLDDADLDALTQSYLDPEAHSIAVYREHIDAVCTAYIKQDVGKIGAASGGRRLRPVKLVAYGFERWATFEEDGPISGGETRSPADGLLMWHGWLDDQFSGLAGELYATRTGKEAQTRDVTHGYLFLQKHKRPAHWERDLTDGMEDTLDEWRDKCRRRSEGETVVDIVNPALDRPGKHVQDMRADEGAELEPEDLDFAHREQQQEETS